MQICMNQIESDRNAFLVIGKHPQFKKKTYINNKINNHQLPGPTYDQLYDLVFIYFNKEKSDMWSFTSLFYIPTYILPHYNLQDIN